jgi:hypothetical protein
MTSFQPTHPGQANSDVTYSCSRPLQLLPPLISHFEAQHVEETVLPAIIVTTSFAVLGAPLSLGS